MPMIDKFCKDCSGKLSKGERNFCYGCKFSESCAGCGAKSTMKTPRFLCHECVSSLPDEHRKALLYAPPSELRGARRAALAALGVDPERRYVPASRGERAPRPDCGHKSYHFRQASLVGGDDDVCDECGHVKRFTAPQQNQGSRT